MRDLPYTIELSRRNGETKTFEYRRATMDDIAEIEDLQNRVYDNLPDKRILCVATHEDLLESLPLDPCFCVTCDGRIVAFTMAVANRICERNYGHYLGYTDEQLLKTMSFDISFVDPEYRGFGLQADFFLLRQEACEDLGATEGLTSIAPANEHSLANAYKTGFEIVDTRPLYGGNERHILRKVFNKGE